jgi:hypothetical protein
MLFPIPIFLIIPFNLFKHMHNLLMVVY